MFLISPHSYPHLEWEYTGIDGNVPDLRGRVGRSSCGRVRHELRQVQDGSRPRSRWRRDALSRSHRRHRPRCRDGRRRDQSRSQSRRRRTQGRHAQARVLDRRREHGLDRRIALAARWDPLMADASNAAGQRRDGAIREPAISTNTCVLLATMTLIALFEWVALLRKAHVRLGQMRDNGGYRAFDPSIEPCSAPPHGTHWPNRPQGGLRRSKSLASSTYGSLSHSFSASRAGALSWGCGTGGVPELCRRVRGLSRACSNFVPGCAGLVPGRMALLLLLFNELERERERRVFRYKKKRHVTRAYARAGARAFGRPRLRARTHARRNVFLEFCAGGVFRQWVQGLSRHISGTALCRG